LWWRERARGKRQQQRRLGNEIEAHGWKWNGMRECERERVME